MVEKERDQEMKKESEGRRKRERGGEERVGK